VPAPQAVLARRFGLGRPVQGGPAVLSEVATQWDELEPGAEIHLTYETTGQTIVWRFAGLGEPHPDNERLRIARYTEHGSWRSPDQVVELAVWPDDQVAAYAKTPHVAIIQPGSGR
jgi:hypothetical protein